VDQPPAAIAAPTFRRRATTALRQRHNWEQLAKFCIVGATGYGVNIAVYALLLNWANLNYRLAATGSFLVAVTNNYVWNRLWTFRHQRGHVAYQGLRFLIVSVIVYGANLALLTGLVEVVGFGKIVSQAIAVVLVTPLNFLGNKLWSFRRRKS
jgi:putative flippase GtrA